MTPLDGDPGPEPPYMEPSGTNGNVLAVANGGDTWQPQDVEAILGAIDNGQPLGPVPSMMTRTDGASLMYRGEAHGLNGEPESGKSWIATNEVRATLDRGERVLYIDAESSGAVIVGRLLALGAAAAQIAGGLVYVRPDDPLTDHALEQLVRQGPYGLAVIDGQTDTYGLLGLDPYSNQDVAVFQRRLVRPFTAAGAAVLLPDHVVKSKEARGRFALGAGHKLAGVAVSYNVEVIDAPSRTHTGTLKVRVMKDRHGHVRANATGDVIALVTIDPSNGGEQVTVTLGPPDSTSTNGKFRPSVYMERVSIFVEQNPGASGNDIAKKVEGKKDYKATATDVLVAEGYITRVPDRQAIRHTSIRPYRRSEDPLARPVPPTSPQLPQGGPNPDLPRSPLALLRGEGEGGEPTEPPQLRPLPTGGMA